MKTIATTVLMAWSVVTASAAQFELMDAQSGATNGPYNFVDGAQFNLDGKVYTLRTIYDSSETTETRLKQIIVPTCNFRGAKLTDVLDYLSSSTQSGAAIPRIHILYTGDTNHQPTVTFEMNIVSLHDVLTTICELTGQQFIVKKTGVIWVSPKDQRKK